MQHRFFALISRMRYIGRWGLMRNTFEENIQEHSHMVAVLAHGLAMIQRDILGEPADPDRCAAAALLALLPPELQAGYRTLLLESDPGTAKIVKAADKLSAYIKCVEELKAGNSEFEAAARQTRQALCDMQLPCLDYFMAHFLDSFQLTLDELE